MYDILCKADDNAPTLSHQTTVFMMSHPLQAWQHSPYIRHCNHCTYVITPSPLTSHPLLYDNTPTFCVTSYELYITSYPILMSSHYCTYGLTAPNMKPHSVWGQHIHLTCDITDTICLLTHTVYITPHPHFLWHHTSCKCGIVCSIQDITSSLFDLKPPFLGYHTHYIRNCVHCICVITPTLLMISQPLYVWYHIQYMWDILPLYLWHHTHPVFWLHHTRHMYDIICPTEDVTSTLSHQATIFMTSHTLQSLHHTPCIRHHTNCIFVITTSPLISHPLLYDITPTYCVISYALYITWYPLLM